MIHKLLLGVVAALLFTVSSMGQTPSSSKVCPAPLSQLAGQQKESAGLAGAGNKVDGLGLPANQTVSPDEGFVIVKADCAGPIRWIVLAGVKVKYLVIPGGSIAVAVPPNAGTISLFAVGLVNGKLTDYAQTNIVVQGTPAPIPGLPPGPNPGPNPAPGQPYHITIVVDMSAATPQIAALLNSQNIRNLVTSKGNFLRVYDVKSPTLVQKKLDGVVQQIGGPPTLIIQRSDGFVIGKWKLPTTEQGIINLIQQNTGG